MDWTDQQKESLASLIPLAVGPIPALVDLAMGGPKSNDDMAAINDAIQEAPINTPEGANSKADWTVWYMGLNWWDKNVSTAVYDEARNRFHDFVIANQPSAAEKETAKQIIAQGVTTEEMEGGTKRSDATGKLPTTKKTNWWIVGFGATVLAGVALGVAKIVSNPLSLFKKS